MFLFLVGGAKTFSVLEECFFSISPFMTPTSFCLGWLGKMFKIAILIIYTIVIAIKFKHDIELVSMDILITIKYTFVV